MATEVTIDSTKNNSTLYQILFINKNILSTDSAPLKNFEVRVTVVLSFLLPLLYIALSSLS